MEFFSTTLLLILIFGALGGFTKFLINLRNDIDKEQKTPTSKTLITLILDVLIGAAASFGVWGISQAMNAEIGQYVIAFIAGIAGLYVTSMLTQSQGYKNERDLLVQSTVDDNEIIEPLRNELELTKLQLEATQKELLETQARLNTTTETTQLQITVKDLQYRLAEAEKRLDDTIIEEHTTKTYSASEQNQQQKNQ